MMAIRKQDLIPTHNMARIKKNENNKGRTIEFSVEVDGIVAVATSGKHLRRLVEKPTAMTRKRASLPAGDWYDGELQHEHDDIMVPGVLAFNIRRRKAREIAATLGVAEFLWGTSGAPVEKHAVKIFEEPKKHSWTIMRRLAFEGLLDMASSLRNIAALPTAVQESQTNMRKFWQLVAVVLGLAVIAGGVKSLAFALLGANGATAWLTSFVVCVWMLLPIANSNDVQTLVRSSFEAAIAAAVSIFMIKLSLYLTNMITDAIWGIVIRMMPFDIPERLQQIINSFINVGAEVFFVAVLLGYAWTRTRQQFMRL